LGAVDASEKTYYAFKEQVEKLITRNFPFGSPQLVLREPALFRVSVTGEVTKSGDVEVWGLSRIAGVIDLLRLPGQAAASGTSPDGAPPRLTPHE